MAATKSAVTWLASTTNTAGSTQTGSTIDLSAGYGASIEAKITNGGTGPTIACDFIVEVSNDNFSADTKTLFRGTAGVVASAVAEWSIVVPKEYSYARVKFTGNTGQSVTVEATGTKVTAI